MLKTSESNGAGDAAGAGWELLRVSRCWPSALAVLLSLASATGGSPENAIQLAVVSFGKDGAPVEEKLPPHIQVPQLVYGAVVENFRFNEEFPIRDESGKLIEEAFLPSGAPVEQFTAPSIRVERMRQDDLPAKKVRALHQSQDGLLWVGTEDGVAHYSGSEFTSFTRGNSTSLADNGACVRCVAEDAQGRIWLGTKRGLLMAEGGAIRPFPGQDDLQGYFINGLAQRISGGMWIAHNNGIAWLDESGVH